MITISIDTENVFNQVNQRTLYIADQIDPAIGELMIDKIPLTEDDKDFFKVNLRYAVVRVGSAIAPITKGVDTPFVLDEENNVAHFSMDETRHKQPSVLKATMPTLIMRALMLWITKEWLRTKGIASNYFQSELMEFEDTQTQLKNLSKQNSSRIKYQMY